VASGCRERDCSRRVMDDKVKVRKVRRDGETNFNDVRFRPTRQKDTGNLIAGRNVVRGAFCLLLFYSLRLPSRPIVPITVRARYVFVPPSLSLSA